MVAWRSRQRGLEQGDISQRVSSATASTVVQIFFKSPSPGSFSGSGVIYLLIETGWRDFA
jgi:hypothetical protein